MLTCTSERVPGFDEGSMIQAEYLVPSSIGGKIVTK